MKAGVVVCGIVADRYDATSRRDTGRSKHLQELPKGLAR